MVISDVSLPGKRLFPALCYRIRKGLVKERSWHGREVVVPTVTVVGGLCPGAGIAIEAIL